MKGVIATDAINRLKRQHENSAPTRLAFRGNGPISSKTETAKNYQRRNRDYEKY